MLSPIISNLPAELKAVPRWVCHRMKVPYNPTRPHLKASVNDESTWGTLQQADLAYRNSGLDGVGLVLNGEDHLVGIDLDKVVHNGSPDPRAMDFLQLLGCRYIELSPSGTGLHGWGRGPDVGGCRGEWNGLHVEIYSRARYLTCTGHTVQAGPVGVLTNLQVTFDAIKRRPPIPTEEAQKKTEVHSGDLLCSSVGFPVRTMPTEVGQRHRCVFELARWLKGSYPESQVDDHRGTVQTWFHMVVNKVGTQEFSVTWMDFRSAWDNVKNPYGSVLRESLASIDETSPLPATFMALGYGEKAVRLYRVCKAFQAREGDGAFFVSARQAGALIQMDHSDAAKVLRAFVADGFLTLECKGVGKFASRYRLRMAVE